ncbi:peptide/nickel transport system permease protein [Hymenobacter luteus]|uniref:Peptide/nickel transport system permease protein n=2 Tax=Hymenobacter TaxID=89966 RepID=A0A7W9SY36_9BACT|nr:MULTISPECIES: ABC transporter permease [Hymenobacter]MBB4599654.1 peptide/nickel transport system permease protein [Hymenobacter latericoloratus]MBB6058036.1 peptide/nickel transport system permease protein [Hymenobacter luteus]
MLGFILSRLWQGVLVLVGVALTVFFLFQVLPGDPVALLAGQRSDAATRAAIAADLGLDQPLPGQLLGYLNDVSPVGVHPRDSAGVAKYGGVQVLPLGAEQGLVLKTPYLRRSFQSNKEVLSILLDHFTGTLWLALAAMLLAAVFGIGLGVVAALKPHSWLDRALVSTSVLGISVPSFVAAILIAMTFGFYWSSWTGLNLTGQLYETDPFSGRHLVLKNLLLPAFALGIRPLAVIVQLTRSSMLEVMSQDYIRTARAKGLSGYRTVVGHALKNALNPVITAVSGWLASLMAGAFFIEYIFNWKGLGTVTLRAVENLDFPVVMGATIFIAALFVLVNIVVDVLYAVLDPRVKLG